MSVENGNRPSRTLDKEATAFYGAVASDIALYLITRSSKVASAIIRVPLGHLLGFREALKRIENIKPAPRNTPNK
jgi:hypothetical protein